MSLEQSLPMTCSLQNDSKKQECMFFSHETKDSQMAKPNISGVGEHNPPWTSFGGSKYLLRNNLL